jgi:hypothetical protein
MNIAVLILLVYLFYSLVNRASLYTVKLTKIKQKYQNGNTGTGHRELRVPMSVILAQPKIQ